MDKPPANMKASRHHAVFLVLFPAVLHLAKAQCEAHCKDVSCCDLSGKHMAQECGGCKDIDYKCRPGTECFTAAARGGSANADSSARGQAGSSSGAKQNKEKIGQEGGPNNIVFGCEPQCENHCIFLSGDVHHECGKCPRDVGHIRCFPGAPSYDKKGYTAEEFDAKLAEAQHQIMAEAAQEGVEEHLAWLGGWLQENGGDPRASVLGTPDLGRLGEIGNVPAGFESDGGLAIHGAEVDGTVGDPMYGRNGGIVFTDGDPDSYHPAKGGLYDTTEAAGSFEELKEQYEIERAHLVKRQEREMEELRFRQKFERDSLDRSANLQAEHFDLSDVQPSLSAAFSDDEDAPSEEDSFLDSLVEDEHAPLEDMMEEMTMEGVLAYFESLGPKEKRKLVMTHKRSSRREQLEPSGRTGIKDEL